mmetsp:Transcript_45306/g.72322  ORF Transcript_45306/g.72322 Transcript_45306/m.72322 type:complete len:100 (+) Transcript_45306:40-339(+)
MNAMLDDLLEEYVVCRVADFGGSKPAVRELLSPLGFSDLIMLLSDLLFLSTSADFLDLESSRLALFLRSFWREIICLLGDSLLFLYVFNMSLQVSCVMQ